MKSHRIFRAFWWSCNALLAACLFATARTGVWEYSVRRYLLERRSFAYLFVSVNSLIFLLLARMFLAWLADHRLAIPRFRLRSNLSRATSAFFTSPEIK